MDYVDVDVFVFSVVSRRSAMTNLINFNSYACQFPLGSEPIYKDDEVTKVGCKVCLKIRGKFYVLRVIAYGNIKEDN